MDENQDQKYRKEQDKDYGFPFVPVEPLGVSQMKPKQEGVNQNAVNSDTPNVEVVLDETPNVVYKEETERNKSRKNGQTPLLVSLVMLLLIILAAMAYFLYYSPEQGTVSESVTIEEPQEVPFNTDASEEIPLDTGILQAVPKELEKTEELAVVVPPTTTESQPEKNGEAGQLRLVEKKEPRASYHLIVASLPNERIAKQEAQPILDMGRDVWLIFPFGDTKNYRLSVGNFSSFKSASEVLPEAKQTFGESTWILKY